MNGWTVVVPVKALANAKSRLAPLDARTRAGLARAFARDTIHAALQADAVTRVIVVGRPSELTGSFEVVAEPPGGGLGGAVRAGIARARASGPAATAVLLGDLPALTPAQLGVALACAARYPRAFVSDSGGAGTTLATSMAGEAFEPSFGPASALRHHASGYVDLVSAHPDVIPEALRRDVDTADDLREVLRLGSGVHTIAAVDRFAGAGHEFTTIQERRQIGTP